VVNESSICRGETISEVRKESVTMGGKGRDPNKQKTRHGGAKKCDCDPASITGQERSIPLGFLGNSKRDDERSSSKRREPPDCDKEKARGVGLRRSRQVGRGPGL